MAASIKVWEDVALLLFQLSCRVFLSKNASSFSLAYPTSLPRLFGNRAVGCVVLHVNALTVNVIESRVMTGSAGIVRSDWPGCLTAAHARSECRCARRVRAFSTERCRFVAG